MTPEELLFLPWNEEKIEALINLITVKRVKEKEESINKLEYTKQKFNDFDSSIDFLEFQIKKNNDNEDIEDYLYKEIQGLYALRRKKINALIGLGELKHLWTIDSIGSYNIFNVDQECFEVNGKSGIYFKIYDRKQKPWMHFVFKILFLEENIILIYNIDNQNIPEVSGKGIVKGMIEALRLKYKVQIISSSNNDQFKIDESEGRIPGVTTYWNKWLRENNKIIYNSSEDRFIYTL